MKSISAVIFLFVLLMPMLPEEALAVSAAPFEFTLTQPDGTAFKARQWGDENLHGWETLDGHTILLDEKIQTWMYAIPGPDGKPVSSGLAAGRAEPPPVSKKLRPSRPEFLKRMTRELKRGDKQALSRVSGPEPVVPPTGTGNMPVILINFNNTTYAYTPSNFNTLLFSGTNDLAHYYSEVSYNAFTVSAGPGGIKGIYTAANGHDYYGTNAGGFTRNDSYRGTLVREAVIAADADGFNFAPYDQDGDCYVDAAVIVHQGTGEEAGYSSTDIWSHRGDLNSAYFYGYSDGGEYETNDNCTANPAVKVKVNDYIIQPELLSPGSMITIGVFAHEYGHALGLPDLYDTDGSSVGIGLWSLMAAGSWTGVVKEGDSPAHIDAWCKYKLGWITPTAVSGTLTGEQIQQACTAADVYRLLPGTPDSGEYFLLENRQLCGFDAGLPGAGLLIWHIDGNTITDNYPTNSVNNFECYPPGFFCGATHHGVALVQADNLYELEQYLDVGNTGDPYRGSTGNTSFTGTSSPSSSLWNGDPSDISITAISASGATMTATLAKSGTLGAAVDNTSLTWSTGTPSWFYQETTSYYGGDAARSGAITHSQSTYMQTTVTGPGMVSFYWKVSSQSGGDYLRFYIDGEEQAGSISGEVGWTEKSFMLAAGPHTLKWTFAKNASGSSGSDAGWVDKVSYVQTVPALGEAVDNTNLPWSTGGNANWASQAIIFFYGGDAAQSGAITDNQSTWIETTVTGPGNLSFYWKVSSESGWDFLRFYIDGVEQADSISGEVGWSLKSFLIGPGTHTLRWAYGKDYSEYSGSDRGWLDKVVFDQFGTCSLGEAVDNASLTWSTGGRASWAGQTGIFYYGGDAAMSGDIFNNQSTWLETTVAGPGTLSFYWKVSSEQDWDFLRFYIDGVEQAGSISGEVDWTQKTFPIAASTHTLKWGYEKDYIFSSGSDTGWVDKIEFIEATPPTGSVSINSGASYTTVTSVNLTLTCSDASGCAEMRFSNDNSIWSTAEAYAGTKSWTLSSGAGTKTVYAKFKDNAGNWSTAVSDTIELRLTHISPAFHNFGAVKEGDDSEPYAFTITNRHGASITLGEAVILGPDGSSFIIVSDTCSGYTLLNNASCQLEVNFFPRDEIADSAPDVFRNALALFTGVIKEATLEIPGQGPRAIAVLKGEMTMPIYRRLTRPYRLIMHGGDLIP